MRAPMCGSQQIDLSVDSENVEHAVMTNPGYIERCEFFIILAPPVMHADRQGLIVDYRTWTRRGAHRAEWHLIAFLVLPIVRGPRPGVLQAVGRQAGLPGNTRAGEVSARRGGFELMVPSASISVASPLYAPNIPTWSLSFGPVIAVSGLVDDPLKLIQSGKFNRAPFIRGDNKGDGTIFVLLLNNIVPGVHVSGRGTSEDVGT